MKRLGRYVGLLLLSALVVPAGCARDKPNRIPFDGVTFKTRTKAVDKKVSRADFTSTIYKVSRSLEGAKEAGRHQGTVYCVTNYGNSDVVWSVGPDIETARLPIVDDTITFRGKCDP